MWTKMKYLWILNTLRADMQVLVAEALQAARLHLLIAIQVIASLAVQRVYLITL